MADAIASYAAKTKTKPFSLALCEWGWQQVWIWGKTVAQSWRVRLVQSRHAWLSLLTTVEPL